MAKGTFGSYVQFDSRKLAEVLRGPEGPVVRQLFKDSDVVVAEAKRLVGYSEPDPLGRPYRKQNHLRDTIVKRIANVDGKVGVIVGSEDPIALLHHEGTEPHVITARRAPYLVFWWGKVGRIVRTKAVRHPGTKPNRYLTKALGALRRRY